MAKKKNSKKKDPKVNEMDAKKIQDQEAEVSAADTDENAIIEVASAAAEGDFASENAGAQADAAVIETASAADVPDAEPDETPQEPSEDTTEEDAEPVMSEASTAGAPEESGTTDFTIVMKPVDPNAEQETAPEPPRPESAEFSESASAPAESVTTALIPGSAKGPYAESSPTEETASDTVPDAESAVVRIKDKSGSKPVTGKVLAIALAAVLLLNGAVTAGIMALYTNSIKDDISDVSKAISDLESENSFRDNGPGMGMTPPDFGSNGNGLNSGNGWDDDDWDDYSYDDDNDALPWAGQQDNQQGAQPGNQQNGQQDGLNDQQNGLNNQQNDQQADLNGQQNSSGASIGIVISDNNGVYITQVTGSNAQKAGFEAGDRITSFDGKSVSDSNSLISEVQKHNAGDTVEVIVERNGSEVRLSTTLE